MGRQSKKVLAECELNTNCTVVCPRMISEVRLLISELRRITLLWDELWLGTLNQHHQDVTRRLTQLDNEVKKVLNNTSLSKEEKTAIIREKHNTVLKPVSLSHWDFPSPFMIESEIACEASPC